MSTSSSPGTTFLHHCFTLNDLNTKGELLTEDLQVTGKSDTIFTSRSNLTYWI